MSLKTAHIALGSNLGDRMSRLRAALDKLEVAGDIQIEAVSPVYSNAAIGLGKVPDFLNAVIRLLTSLSPEELLERCLSIEADLGRLRSDQPTSRTIDLDLLLYEDVRLNSPRLQLPHPRIEQRDFVARPSWISIPILQYPENQYRPSSPPFLRVGFFLGRKPFAKPALPAFVQSYILL